LIYLAGRGWLNFCPQHQLQKLLSHRHLQARHYGRGALNFLNIFDALFHFIRNEFSSLDQAINISPSLKCQF
jgi:hypothetical protein